MIPLTDEKIIYYEKQKNYTNYVKKISIMIKMKK